MRQILESTDLTLTLKKRSLSCLRCTRVRAPMLALKIQPRGGNTLANIFSRDRAKETQRLSFLVGKSG